MANGAEHLRAAKRATVAVTLAGTGMIAWARYADPSVDIQLPAITLGLIVAGMLQGIVTDPDLDMLQITASERRKLDKRPFFGRIWLAIWAPYGAIMSHRGISHAPIIGTMTRAIYLYWWLAAVAFRTELDLTKYVPYLSAFFAGWCLQDLVHLHKDRWGFSWRL